MKTLHFFVLLVGCGASSVPTETTPVVQVRNEEAFAELQRAEERYDAMGALSLDCSSETTLVRFIECLRVQTRGLTDITEEVLEAFSLVFDHNDAPSTVAALAAHARIMTAIADAMKNVEVPEIYPEALLEESVRMSEEARRAAHVHVEAAVVAVFENPRSRIVCRSVLHDVRGLRLAQAQNVDPQFSEESAGRLSRMSEEEIGACIEQVRVDATADVEPYTPGEFNLQR